MTAANYSLFVAVIFALAAVAQTFRAIMGVQIVVGQFSIPVWVSWIACVIAIILAWLGSTASQG